MSDRARIVVSRPVAGHLNQGEQKETLMLDYTNRELEDQIDEVRARLRRLEEKDNEQHWEILQALNDLQKEVDALKPATGDQPPATEQTRPT